jgi:uroporphyrinogen-III synthase
VSGPLAGQVVVVTRPARQAERMLRLLEENGARAVAFPTIAIEPVPGHEGAQAVSDGRPVDWIVYTSANAVAHSPATPSPTTKIAAIGKATARALEAAGIRVDATPASGSDTESLLALPAFAELAGRRVLIVKGVGGRDALRAGLAARGAEVTTAEVYRRVPVEPVAGAVEALRRACATGRAVIAATSVEVLESLLDGVPESRVPDLRDAALLVPGKRVAAAARRLAWRGALLVASSAEDDAMLAALVARTVEGGPSDTA